MTTSGGLYHLEKTNSERFLAFYSYSRIIYSLLSYKHVAIFCWNSACREYLSLKTEALMTFLYFCFLSYSIAFDSSLFSGTDRARPKSHILTLHLLFTRKLAGLRSLWKMLAECRNLMEQSMLYRRVTTCSWLKIEPSRLFNSFLMSVWPFSITMNIWSNF